jgi:peroxiredoxin
MLFLSFQKSLSLALTLTLALATVPASYAIKVGDDIPDDVKLHYGFPPESVDLKERLAGKRSIVVGLPGAFTPTWSTRQIPGYLSNLDALKAMGIDEVLVYSGNDGAVMQAWAENQGVPEDSILKLMGDPTAAVTKALDMELTHEGPQSIGLLGRCKRFALYVVDGVVKIVRVAESPDDPAGDDFPDVTLVEAMMEAIEALESSSGGSSEL